MEIEGIPGSRITAKVVDTDLLQTNGISYTRYLVEVTVNGFGQTKKIDVILREDHDDFSV